MANNPDGKYESYHEVPADKYIFIANTAIHKRFFLYWTTILFTGTLALTLLSIYTPIWLILGTAAFNFFIAQYWYITVPAIAIATGISYLWMQRRSKQKARFRAERERARRLQNIILSGGENKK